MVQIDQSSGPAIRRRSRRRQHPLLHALLLLALTAACTAAGISGFAWWQDRPLRKISESLNADAYQTALKRADQFLAQNPRDSRVLILKARALSGLNQHPAADLLFQQAALQLDGFPDDPAALRAWSVSLLHLEQWPRAIKVQETLLLSYPDDAEILYRLTVARIRIFQYDAALDSATRLAAIPGQVQRANVVIGTIHHDQGNGRAALEAWEKILSLNPEATDLQIPAGEFFAMMGEELLESGSLQRSGEFLKRSAESVTSARTYALLGKALFQQGLESEAISAWETALTHDAREPLALEELANVSLRKSEPQRAIDLVTPLTKSGHLKSSAAYILQRAYTQLGKPDESEVWRGRANLLRDAERNRGTLHELQRKARDQFWGGFLRAYQLADEQRWDESARLVADLLPQRPTEPLLLLLADSVRQRSQLPSLESLTNQKY